MRLAAYALAAAGGLMQAASFAPLHAWPLQVLGVACLAGALQAATPKRAFRLGWLFGACWITATVWWVYISMHRYGGMPAPLAGLATLLLGALLALYYGVAAAAWVRWLRDGRAPSLAFGAAWLAAELARAVLFTGFPWGAGGYAHTVGPLAGWAPWIGVYGIGALAAWLGAALAAALHRRAAPARALRALAAPLVLALLGPALPGDFTRPSGTLAVTLLQPNVAQDLKFDPAQMAGVLRWHVDALRSARGTLVVTPESSVPVPAQYIEPDVQQALQAPFATGERTALVGLFVGNDADGYTNSVVALSPGSTLQQPAYRYGKQHLLPFGEFIPPGFDWFVALMEIPIGDQERGRNAEPLSVAGQRVRPLICYEDLFGEDFAAAVVGERGATVLANATNLAWFGPWMVQDQHLQFSQMRALEFQRPMVRATNTGATAAIDHRARVLARLPADQEGTLDVTVEGRTGDTPYARWLAAAHLWPLAAFAALVVLLGASGRPRSRGGPP